jgi:hypothetical protein
MTKNIFDALPAAFQYRAAQLTLILELKYSWIEMHQMTEYFNQILLITLNCVVISEVFKEKSYPRIEFSDKTRAFIRHNTTEYEY